MGPGVPQYLRGWGFLFTYSKGPLYHQCLLQAPTIVDAPSCFLKLSHTTKHLLVHIIFAFDFSSLSKLSTTCEESIGKLEYLSAVKMRHCFSMLDFSSFEKCAICYTLPPHGKIERERQKGRPGK